MSLIFVFVCSVCIFLLRFAQWYVFFGRKTKQTYLANVDSWVFLNDARKIRKGGFKLSSRYRENVLESEKYYPPLFFYLLAVVPEKYVKYVIEYFSALIDAFLASVLFSSIAILTNNLEYGFLGVFVYFSSPMIFQQNFCLCVRPLSILLVSSVYLVFCSFSLLNFFILSLLIALALLLHKFATQVIFFTSLAFTLVGRFDYLLALSTGFLIALLASKGYYWKVLNAHINRLRSTDLKQFAKSRTQNPLKRTAALAVYCPWLTFFAVSIFFLGWGIFSQLLLYSVIWTVALTALSVITNFRVFKALGEGWRYLGYLVFPLAFYVVAAIDRAPALQWVYMIFALSGLLASYLYSKRLYQSHVRYLVTQEDIDMFKRVSAVEGRTVIAYPREFTNIITYFSEKDYAAEPELADIALINTELIQKDSVASSEAKTYTLRFEEKRWACYSRPFPTTGHMVR